MDISNATAAPVKSKPRSREPDNPAAIRGGGPPPPRGAAVRIVTFRDAGPVLHRIFEETIANFPPCPSDEQLAALIAEDIPRVDERCPLLRKVVSCLSSPGGPETLILEGLPSHGDPANPRLEQAVALAVCMLAGHGLEPYQFREEKGGRLISMLTPTPGFEGLQSGNSATAFGHHADFAYLPAWARPAYNVLFGVESDGTETTYASARDAEARLDGVLRSTLRSSRFIHPIPGEMGIADGGRAAPVLFDAPCGSVGIAIRKETRPADPDDGVAQVALDRLREELARVEIPFRLEPGTYALVNNVLGTHSRGQIGAEGRRTIGRIYLQDLAELRKGVRIFSATQPLC